MGRQGSTHRQTFTTPSPSPVNNRMPRRSNSKALMRLLCSCKFRPKFPSSREVNDSKLSKSPLRRLANALALSLCLAKFRCLPLLSREETSHRRIYPNVLKKNNKKKGSNQCL